MRYFVFTHLIWELIDYAHYLTVNLESKDYNGGLWKFYDVWSVLQWSFSMN